VEEDDESEQRLIHQYIDAPRYAPETLADEDVHQRADPRDEEARRQVYDQTSDPAVALEGEAAPEPEHDRSEERPGVRPGEEPDEGDEERERCAGRARTDVRFTGDQRAEERPCAHDQSPLYPAVAERARQNRFLQRSPGADGLSLLRRPDRSSSSLALKMRRAQRRATARRRAAAGQGQTAIRRD
jgi:hypothetical protein